MQKVSLVLLDFSLYKMIRLASLQKGLLLIAIIYMGFNLYNISCLVL
jgi:hypothetical protein